MPHEPTPVNQQYLVVVLIALAAVFSLIFVVCSVVAMITDLLRYEIPNWLCIILAAGYLPFALTIGVGWEQIAVHLAIGFAALVVGFVLDLAKLFGAGDGKLVAAMILWLAPGDIAPFLILICLFGGATALIILLFRALPVPAKWLANPSLDRLHDKSQKMPYGLAIGSAGLMIYQNILPLL